MSKEFSTSLNATAKGFPNHKLPKSDILIYIHLAGILMTNMPFGIVYSRNRLQSFWDWDLTMFF